ncbi:MAG TPA: substrate-binding domain-containing protein, partial [Chitinophagaceae bacterium]|nr:substrate-binding domain-containing protein [Chitinophagaceae bacterium]
AERIRATAKAMDYRTNQIAKSLKTNRTYTIGLVLADIANPFSAALARILEDEADCFGYTVIFGSSDENPEKYKKILDALVNRQADGLILSPPQHAEAEIVSLQQQQLPFVLIDRYFPGINCNYVVLNNFKAAYDATIHLLQCGHTRVAILNYASDLVHLQERTNGYRAAMQTQGLHESGALVHTLPAIDLQEEVAMAINQLLALDQPATAILFGSNVIAMHGVKYINEKNIRVPDQLALACFDETDAFDLFYAPLTCLRQPIKPMGAMAVKLLLDAIEHPSNEPQQLQFDASLIVRASSGRPSGPA